MIGLFEGNGAGDLSKLPDSSEARNKFAQLFRSFNALLEAAKVQGFRWDESEYSSPWGMMLWKRRSRWEPARTNVVQSVANCTR